jgi:4-hydroxy-3-polyprenylbenzoate decarboxylase
MESLNELLKEKLEDLQKTPFIIICDDSSFMGAAINNYLWVTYTRCNPSHDIYGIDSFVNYKHGDVTGR